MRQRRMRGFRHVKRTEGAVLDEVGEVRVGDESGEKPLDKLECAMANMNLLRKEKHVVQD